MKTQYINTCTATPYSISPLPRLLGWILPVSPGAAVWLWFWAWAACALSTNVCRQDLHTTCRQVNNFGSFDPNNSLHISHALRNADGGLSVVSASMMLPINILHYCILKSKFKFPSFALFSFMHSPHTNTNHVSLVLEKLLISFHSAHAAASVFINYNYGIIIIMSCISVSLSWTSFYVCECIMTWIRQCS